MLGGGQRTGAPNSGRTSRSAEQGEVRAAPRRGGRSGSRRPARDETAPESKRAPAVGKGRGVALSLPRVLEAAALPSSFEMPPRSCCTPKCTHGCMCPCVCVCACACKRLRFCLGGSGNLATSSEHRRSFIDSRDQRVARPTGSPLYGFSHLPRNRHRPPGHGCALPGGQDRTCGASAPRHTLSAGPTRRSLPCALPLCPQPTSRSRLFKAFLATVLVSDEAE